MTTIFAQTLFLFLFLFPFVVYANLRGATSDPHMRMLNVMRRANGMDSASTPGQGGAGADHSMAAGLTRSAAKNIPDIIVKASQMPSVAPSQAPSNTGPPVPPRGVVAPSDLDSCSVTLDVICRESSTGLPCDEMNLIVDECLELPTYISFRYNGGDCNQSSNIQPTYDFACEDFYGGPPTDQEESSFIVTTNVDTGVIYHADFVRVGELFIVEEIDGAFPSAMNITVYSSADTSPQNVLQTVVMDTSCSQNLFLADRYGSFHLVGFVNELQGNVTTFVGATYSYVVSNAATESGTSGTATLSTLTSISNELVNLTEQVNGVALTTNDSLLVEMAFIVDLSVRLRYTVFSTVQGVSPGGFVCRASQFDSFIAGIF